jgi:Protein of unknown function (DUF2878)
MSRANVRKLSTTTIVTNAVLFQCGWFACVLGAANGAPWIGLAAVGAVAAWHLARASERGPELSLLLLTLLVGMLFETLLAQTGWVRFEAGVVIAGAAPAWMAALWANFATTLNVSLRPLRDRLGLAALLGAVGAPLAYYSGSRLGALEMTAAVPALVAVGAGWLLLSPLLFLAARRLDGYARR